MRNIYFVNFTSVIFFFLKGAYTIYIASLEHIEYFDTQYVVLHIHYYSRTVSR